MATKMLKDIQRGDRVVLHGPDGFGEVFSIAPAPLFGGAGFRPIEIVWRREDNHEKGWHVGHPEDVVEVK